MERQRPFSAIYSHSYSRSPDQRVSFSREISCADPRLRMKNPSADRRLDVEKRPRRALFHLRFFTVFNKKFLRVATYIAGQDLYTTTHAEASCGLFFSVLSFFFCFILTCIEYAYAENRTAGIGTVAHTRRRRREGKIERERVGEANDACKAFSTTDILAIGHDIVYRYIRCRRHCV